MSGYVALPIFQPNGRRTIGMPPIFIGKGHCDECNGFHKLERCPLCGDWLEIGYGIGFGGGMGAYYFCRSEGCPWYFKELDWESEAS